MWDSFDKLLLSRLSFGCDVVVGRAEEGAPLSGLPSRGQVNKTKINSRMFSCNMLLKKYILFSLCE